MRNSHHGHPPKANIPAIAPKGSRRDASSGIRLSSRPSPSCWATSSNCSSPMPQSSVPGFPVYLILQFSPYYFFADAKLQKNSGPAKRQATNFCLIIVNPFSCAHTAYLTSSIRPQPSAISPHMSPWYIPTPCAPYLPIYPSFVIFSLTASLI